MHTHHPHRHQNQLSLFQKARELPNRHISVAAYTGESYVVRFLTALIIVCAAAYLYFVSLSIMNVIGSREAAAESDRRQSSVGMLEQEYFSLSKEVTPGIAERMGLSKTDVTTFVRRTSGMATNIRSQDI